MAYTVNKTDGSIFAVVADGTLNTDSNVTLVGKNFAGYGEFLNENFVQLLENAANNAAPSSPLTGQLWYDTSAGLLKVFNGSDFKTISAATASNNEPTNNVVGDIWFDTVNNQLNVYNGSDFTLVGPLGAGPGAGETGAIPTTIVDNLSVEHFVVRIVVDDATVAIVSKDAAFTPASAITGFTTTIKPGINLPDSALSGQTLLFQGTATNAQTLDGVDSTGFLSSTGNDTTSGRLTIENNSGLVVGEGNEASLNIAGTDFRIDNRETNGDLVLRVNDGGAQTAAITIDGSTTDVSFAADINASGDVTSTNLIASGSVSLPEIVKTGTDGTGNIGQSDNSFNVVHAKATSAQYADLAERFAADVIYEAGTVVELGGTAEITQASDELSDKVFGVISTRAAYLMNAGSGGDETHPPVAMTGRVPVKVIGKVNLGDRLVSAGNGTARAAIEGEATPFNTIGRSLEYKYNEEIETIEAIVKIV